MMKQLKKYDVGNIPVFEKIQTDECCGCEACRNICPKNIISMKAGKYGFLYPYIDQNQCIRCMKCLEVCPIISPPKSTGHIRKTYGGYAMDKHIVASSSSGGFFSVLAEMFLKSDNTCVVAVVWSDDFRSVYHICGGLDDLEKMRGSKYIQSRKKNIYRVIKQKLKAEKSVLFVGCPCEVAGLKNYLGKNYENLYCIDMVCQGATSPRVMKEYADSLEKRYKAKITDINLRYVGGKIWIPQWIKVQFDNNKIYLDVFYDTSLGRAVHLMQRPACYICRFAGDKRCSDITLGDFHGADAQKSYYNANGTSVIVINSEKGEKLIENISAQDICMEPVIYEEVAKHNPRIDHPWKPFDQSKQFWADFEMYGLEVATRKSLTLKRRVKIRLPKKLKRKL